MTVFHPTRTSGRTAFTAPLTYIGLWRNGSQFTTQLMFSELFSLHCVYTLNLGLRLDDFHNINTIPVRPVGTSEK